MIMVTGGAYQGKTAYVTEKLGLAENDISDGAVCAVETLRTARCITNYHELVRRLGDECISFTQELCRTNKEVIIIIDEIGCGIVPMEKSERVWRENAGRCGCIIAACSEKVIRMVCGIPVIIKEVS
jgi:adenosyl cobinamide kinase/adenosyl cobinamide phosphate guanylyltransferase